MGKGVNPPRIREAAYPLSNFFANALLLSGSNARLAISGRLVKYPDFPYALARYIDKMYQIIGLKRFIYGLLPDSI